MAAIITRAGKGSPLTNAEMDANLVNLNNAVIAAPGDVKGPAGATDKAIVRFDGVTGKLVQSSSWQISDPGHLLPAGAGVSDIGQDALRARTIFGTTGDFIGSLYVGNTSYLTNGLQTFAAGFGPFIDLVRANGTAAAPTALKAFDQIGALTAKGRAATTWSAAQAAIVFETPADWTDTSQPAHINFQTTPAGSTTTLNRWQLNSAGHIMPFIDNAFDIGSATGRARNVWAFQGTFSGPVYAGLDRTMLLSADATNAILYFDNTAANAAILYDKGPNQFQFFGPTATLKINGATGNLITPGSVQAESVSAGPSGMLSMGGQAGVNSVLYLDAVTPGKVAAFVYQFPSNKIDVFAAGMQIATFDPVDQSLSVLGPVRGGVATFARTISRGATGTGYITSNQGGPQNSGYIEFYDAADIRVGFIGYAYSVNKTISISADGGYNYVFTEPLTVNGEITFGPGADKVEPRGRYYGVNVQPGTVNAYTLVAADQGKLVIMTPGGANTITVPPNSAVPFPLGTRIDIATASPDGMTSIVPGAGVTMQSAKGKRKLASTFSGASLVKTDVTDGWILFGDLA